MAFCVNLSLGLSTTGSGYGGAIIYKIVQAYKKKSKYLSRVEKLSRVSIGWGCR